MEKLRIATRKSPLAMWQAEHVAARLAECDVPTKLIPLESSGDTDMRPIDGTRQTGVFTKRIQLALFENEADIAVHSLKDLPTDGDPLLLLAAVPERETVADALVSTHRWSVDELPEGARIGTGSRRRMAQLLHRRPDLQVSPIRGNVQTRLAKLDRGEFDAIVLAEAGILRLKMDDLTRYTLSMDEMLPAPGQGALGIEVRAADARAIDAVSQLDHRPTRAAVTAERVLLAALHGGCLAPIAALGQSSDQSVSLRASVLTADGKEKLEEAEQLDLAGSETRAAAEKLGRIVSNRLLENGAAEMLRR